MSKIFFYRHAQASFGADNYDILSSKGERQAQLLGEYLAERKLIFNKVFVGPLHRQQQTFDIVRQVYSAKDLPIPEPVHVAGLLEHEGHKALKLLLPELEQSDPVIKSLIDKIKADPSRKRSNGLLMFQHFLDRWVDGEVEAKNILTWPEFRRSVKEGLNTILKDTKPGETIAAFTSGGTISAITAESLKMEDEKRVIALNFAHRNTAFTSFFYSQNKFNLLAFNELPHLEGEMVTFV